MRVTKAPRYQGKILTWKDEQGYGFIAPNGGGPAVFLHIKSFRTPGTRPVQGNVVTYELTINAQGQPRAALAAFVGARIVAPPPVRTAGRALATTAGFFGLLAVLVATGQLPRQAWWLYVGASVVTFGAYWFDKRAARQQGQRTRESTLHLLALAGGWPGALLAQQLLRHKSKKASFRVEFRWTVAVNCAALAWLSSPWGATALAGLRF